ncbi:hypothetical protein [Borrelia puertoricensis]|uniref:hypothetical protein n=1 Tax=Borrelia puertoricensis TaxID=2756107 RepID=UPI001FF6C208|nr:hypothetical protein [Borrelia puertoricensis]
MKQVLILMLFFVCIVVSFAQSYDEIASDTVATEGNMDNKLLIYELHKQNTLVPFLLNFLWVLVQVHSCKEILLVDY